MSNDTDLAGALAAATGADAMLDREIADATGFALEPFTSSVDAARALFEHLLPEWHLHVGYGATGVFPYATASLGDRSFPSEAPTVPLAILRAAWSAQLTTAKR